MRPRPTFRAGRHYNEGELVAPVTPAAIVREIDPDCFGLAAPGSLELLGELLGDQRALRAALTEALPSTADVRATLKAIAAHPDAVDLSCVDEASRALLYAGAWRRFQTIGARDLGEAASEALAALGRGADGRRSWADADFSFVCACVAFLRDHGRTRSTDDILDFIAACARLAGIKIGESSPRVRKLVAEARRRSSSSP